MNNMIIVGSKRNGYLINLEEKSLTINYFNSLYENLFEKKIKHKEISFSEIKYINVTYSASDRSIWGIDSSLVLEVYTNDGKKYLMHGNRSYKRRFFTSIWNSKSTRNYFFR